MPPWAFPGGVEDVFPARLRRGPGVSPMGVDPHGRHTGISPGPHRILSGLPGRDGESLDGSNSRDTGNIQGWIRLGLSVQQTSLILARCRAGSLSIKLTLTHSSSPPTPLKRTNFPDEP